MAIGARTIHPVRDIVEALRSGVEFLFPQVCAVCSASIRATPSGRLTNPLCDFCCPWTNGGEFVPEGCAWCQTPVLQPTEVCEGCLASPNSFTELRSLYWYEGKAEALMKVFKYASRQSLGRLFADMICERWRLRSGARLSIIPDILLTIPTSRAAFFRRGFQPTAILGHYLAKRLGVEFSTKGIFTAGAREPQAALTSVLARKLNVANIYRADPRVVCGKSILLIDDVVTTGATINSAARSLLEAGATGVFVQTVCRAKNFAKYRNGMDLELNAPSGVIAA